MACLRLKRYREFVEEGMKKPGPNPLKEVLASTFLGGLEFVERMRNYVGSKEEVRDVPSLRFFERRKGWEEIGRVVGEVLGEGHRLVKKFGIYMSHGYGGYSLKEIGKFYGMEGSAVSQAVRRFRGEIAGDRKLRKWFGEITDKLRC